MAGKKRKGSTKRSTAKRTRSSPRLANTSKNVTEAVAAQDESSFSVVPSKSTSLTDATSSNIEVTVFPAQQSSIGDGEYLFTPMELVVTGSVNADQSNANAAGTIVNKKCNSSASLKGLRINMDRVSEAQQGSSTLTSSVQKRPSVIEVDSSQNSPEILLDVSSASECNSSTTKHTSETSQQESSTTNSENQPCSEPSSSSDLNTNGELVCSVVQPDTPGHESRQDSIIEIDNSQNFLESVSLETAIRLDHILPLRTSNTELENEQDSLVPGTSNNGPCTVDTPEVVVIDLDKVPDLPESPVGDDVIEIQPPEDASRRSPVRRHNEVVDLTDSEDNYPLSVFRTNDDRDDSGEQQRRNQLLYSVLEDDESFNDMIDLPSVLPRFRLPSLEISPPKSSTSPAKRGIVCPVCMDDAKQISEGKRQLISTNCGHVFCNECILQAVETQHRCPTCRKKLTKKQWHPLYI